MLALITGGARSGKSRFAERYAAGLAASGVYIATSQVYDEEMEERVKLHRTQREASGYTWETIEEPLLLPELLDRLNSKEEQDSLPQAERPPLVLVDCLTLWLTNVMLEDHADIDDTPRGIHRMQDNAKTAIERLAEAVTQYRGILLLVTNEVGNGVVPEYPLGRLYRDMAGLMNQRLAALCDEVFLVTAGIPVELKRLAFQIPTLPAE